MSFNVWEKFMEMAKSLREYYGYGVEIVRVDKESIEIYTIRIEIDKCNQPKYYT